MPLSKIDSDSLSAPLTVPAGSAAAPAITTTGDTNTGIFFPAADTIAFAEGGVESMRIDSSGNVGIGTSSPVARLNVSVADSGNIVISNTNDGHTGGLAFGDTSSNSSGRISYDHGSNAMRFDTAAAERMRIDSSGNLLVGNSTGVGSSRFLVTCATTDYSARFVSNSATEPYGPIIDYTGAAPNDTSKWFLTCRDTSATRFQARSNGGLANYSANNVNLSDRREKINFSPAKSYLDVICAIPVQTFNYIDQNMEEDGGLTLGVVAQDLQAVAPEMVMESNWGTQEDPKMRLSIYQTDLQYALMKSIQELKAIVDAQGAEIAALKGTP